MREHDSFYQYLLAQCQSADLDHRLGALEDLRAHEYLDLLVPQFLLDRLNATSHWQEQMALLQLMCEIKKPLPLQALMAILEDRQTSSVFLRMQVAHVLAVVQAEEVLDPLLRLLADPNEEIAVREAITGDLALWGERIPRELRLSLLADPQLCAAALDMWRTLPAASIPIEAIVPYCTHEDPYLRAAAIKTLLAADERVPLEQSLRPCMTLSQKCALPLRMDASASLSSLGIRSRSNRCCWPWVMSTHRCEKICWTPWAKPPCASLWNLWPQRLQILRPMYGARHLRHYR